MQRTTYVYLGRDSRDHSIKVWERGKPAWGVRNNGQWGRVGERSEDNAAYICPEPAVMAAKQGSSES